MHPGQEALLSNPCRQQVWGPESAQVQEAVHGRLRVRRQELQEQTRLVFRQLDQSFRDDRRDRQEPLLDAQLEASEVLQPLAARELSEPQEVLPHPLCLPLAWPPGRIFPVLQPRHALR